MCTTSALPFSACYIEQEDMGVFQFWDREQRSNESQKAVIIDVMEYMGEIGFEMANCLIFFFICELSPFFEFILIDYLNPFHLKKSIR